MAATEDRRGLDATEEWRKDLYEATPERDALFTTMSGLPVEPLYTPDNVGLDYERDLGFPGVYPFTRGVYASMYRGQALDDAAVRRLRHRRRDERPLPLPARARADRPLDRLRHADPDGLRLATTRSRSARWGVRAWRSTRSTDMEQLFAGIPLDEVSTSMTINAPAAMLLAFYICVGARSRGFGPEKLRGTIQNGHPQGVHRAERVDLPAGAVDAARAWT